MKTIEGIIEYAMKANHPDKDYVVDGWVPGKIYGYADLYKINPDSFYSEDDMYEYIKKDLALVAGGGYRTDTIENVSYKFVEV